MAVLLLEGFDMYNGLGANTGLNAKWVNSSGLGQGMTAGRFGGQCWRMQGSIGQAIDKQFGGTNTTFTIGFAARLSSFASSPVQKCHVGLTKWGSFFQCGISFDAGGAIIAYRLSSDTAGTSLGTTGPGAMAVNVWHYIEVEIVVSTTVGRMTIYVDGVQKLNVTGVNTANGGAGTTADTIHMGSVNGGGAFGLCDIDDLYVIDTAAKLGERRVETLRPNADTATKQWTPDTGTVDFSRVNATLAQSVTYVQASTVGNLDLYDIADLSSTPGTIDAVQYNVFAQKTDANTRAIAVVGDISGVQQQSPDMSLGSSVGKFEYLIATKPGGGSWTAADVNALRIGPKVTV